MSSYYLKDLILFKNIINSLKNEPGTEKNSWTRRHQTRSSLKIFKIIVGIKGNNLIRSYFSIMLCQHISVHGFFNFPLI